VGLSQVEKFQKTKRQVPEFRSRIDRSASPSDYRLPTSDFSILLIWSAMHGFFNHFRGGDDRGIQFRPAPSHFQGQPRKIDDASVPAVTTKS